MQELFGFLGLLMNGSVVCGDEDWLEFEVAVVVEVLMVQEGCFVGYFISTKGVLVGIFNGVHDIPIQITVEYEISCNFSSTDGVITFFVDEASLLNK